MADLSKSKLQKLVYKELLAIVRSEKTSAAVKTQALTQMAKLADQLPDEVAGDELDAFLSDAK